MPPFRKRCATPKWIISTWQHLRLWRNYNISVVFNFHRSISQLTTVDALRPALCHCFATLDLDSDRWRLFSSPNVDWFYDCSLVMNHNQFRSMSLEPLGVWGQSEFPYQIQLRPAPRLGRCCGLIAVIFYYIHRYHSRNNPWSPKFLFDPQLHARVWTLPQGKWAR